MPGSPIVSRSEAHAKRTNHQFVPGIGYLVHSGPPELPATAKGSNNCAPASGTVDKSLHVFQPPNGHPEMVMAWVARENAWSSRHPERGNRLAWPVEHLMRAGWRYLRPATDADLVADDPTLSDKINESVRKKPRNR